jgi:hypothetical protein
VVFFGAGPLLPFLLLYDIATCLLLERSVASPTVQSLVSRGMQLQHRSIPLSTPLFPKGISLSCDGETRTGTDSL